jgi:uncharacterized protein (DUF1697 family)
MTVHIALLRGVNVGGRNQIKMAALRELCEPLGLAGAQTLLQSGNLVFASGDRGAALSSRIADAIERSFGFRTEVILRTADALADTIARNPFAGRDDVDARRLLVMFLAAAPAADADDRLAALDVGREEARLDRRQVYLHYPDGVGRSKLTNALLERAVGTAGTARNWHTVTRLGTLAAALKRT